MNYKAILFDFDYTLADSSRGIVTCFQRVLQRHGYHNITDEAIKRTIGKTLENSFSILTGVTDMDQLTAWREAYGKEADVYMTASTILFPDTLDVLKTLKERGFKIGILSTKYRFRILEFFNNHLPSTWFDVIIGGEDVAAHKPDPEGLYTALSKLNITAEQALYIGDSTVDAETAASAGTNFIGVTTGMTTREELAAFPHIKIVTTLKEILS